MVFKVTAAAADFLEGLANELDVPESRYKEAERRYLSVGEWLGRDESSLREFSPNVYVQGSFRLGTPIRPVNDDEHYDIDLVCELSLGKHEITQQELKEKLGVEMKLYAKQYGIKEVSEGRRCWTLDYAEGAQFHLDALPAIPDGEGRRIALESLNLSSEWSQSAIAITDTESANFTERARNWPHSNPRGFNEWFKSRMIVAFNEERAQLALEAYANVEDVPEREVKTPLQRVIQILKRHRDIRFSSKPDVKPISVIITTLAAKAYGNQRSLSEALAHIVENMHLHIKERNGVWWIENPTDPAENFADKWESNPERKEAFFKWLEYAREDFTEIATENNRHLILEAATESFGASVASRAAGRAGAQQGAKGALALFQRAKNVLGAAHRQTAPWVVRKSGKVEIDRVRMFRDGFRPDVLVHDSAPVNKGVKLEFRAATQVRKPYDVYWQIVNTGQEASAANDMRGGFNAGVTVRGEIVHTENAAYAGAHSVECFIVKDNVLLARSGAFIVNIK